MINTEDETSVFCVVVDSAETPEVVVVDRESSVSTENEWSGGWEVIFETPGAVLDT